MTQADDLSMLDEQDEGQAALVLWQYRDDTSLFQNMDGPMSSRCERALTNGERAFTIPRQTAPEHCWHERWHNIVVDITTFKQTNPDTGTVRDIRRLQQTHPTAPP